LLYNFLVTSILKVVWSEIVDSLNAEKFTCQRNNVNSTISYSFLYILTSSSYPSLKSSRGNKRRLSCVPDREVKVSWDFPRTRLIRGNALHQDGPEAEHDVL